MIVSKVAHLLNLLRTHQKHKEENASKFNVIRSLLIVTKAIDDYDVS